MPVPNTPTRGEAEDLVRLRGMLNHALNLAADTTDWGLHSALIALDGVGEYALWLVVQHRGLELSPQSKFHALLNAVAAELKDDGWGQPGRREVLNLRDARNPAQHGGVLPDPRHMPAWRSATGEFVRSLIQAGYGRDLDRALYADALVDHDLRQLIADAEVQLTDARYAEAIETAVRALYAGRQRWREQRHHAEGVLPYSELRLPDARFPDLDENTDDVAMFASDLSEYFWLKSARFQIVGHGATPSREDPERAIAFAYHWLLRWQAFDERYPAERWRESFASQRPPVTPNGVPEIVEVSVLDEQVLGPNRARRLDVTIANLPDEGRSDWAEPISGAARRTAAAHGFAPWQLIVGERLPRLGRFTVFVDPDLPPPAINVLLADLVARTTRMYEARQRSIDETKDILRSVTDAIDSALAAGAPDLFAPATAKITVGDDDEAVWVQVPVHALGEEPWQVAQIINNAVKHLADVTATENFIAFSTPLNGLGPAADELTEAARRAQDHIVHQRQHQHETRQKTAGLVAELTDQATWTVTDATVSSAASHE